MHRALVLYNGRIRKDLQVAPEARVSTVRVHRALMWYNLLIQKDFRIAPEAFEWRFFSGSIETNSSEIWIRTITHNESTDFILEHMARQEC